MLKDKTRAILDYIIKHSKIVFPIIVIAVVAVTVSIALNANKAKAEQGADGQEEVVQGISAGAVGGMEVQNLPQEDAVPETVPLTVNENGDIYSLVATYYTAWVMGDEETLRSIYDEISDNEMLRYVETSKYMDYLPKLEIYTKPGLTEGTTLAYVYYRLCFVKHEEEVPGYEVLYICDDGEDGLYIKNEKNFTQEERDYITKVSLQVDVVEFNNRINVEYNDLMEVNPDLLAYMGEFGSQVDVAIGVALAGQNAGQTGQEEDNQGEGGDEPAQPEETVQPPVESGPQYASASTTVNVRSSDSEQADKLGKVTEGTRVQVQEVLVNGWTKIVYDGKDGYIKSQYLNMEENASSLEVIGTVTANTNINVRAAASVDAESLGILVGGDSVELFAKEGEWCKVKYNGRVAYVKSDYVSVNE